MHYALLYGFHVNLVRVHVYCVQDHQQPRVLRPVAQHGIAERKHLLELVYFWRSGGASQHHLHLHHDVPRSQADARGRIPHRRRQLLPLHSLPRRRGWDFPPSQHVNHRAYDVIFGFRFSGFSDVTDDDREGGDHGLVQRHLRVHGRVVSDARASRGGGVELDDGASGGHDSSVLWRTAGNSTTIMVIARTYRSFSGYFGSFTDECLGSSSFRNIRYSQRRFRSGVDSAS